MRMPFSPMRGTTPSAPAVGMIRALLSALLLSRASCSFSHVRRRTLRQPSVSTLGGARRSSGDAIFRGQLSISQRWLSTMDTSLAALPTQLFSQAALALSAAVILLYDHIITFDSEYCGIWKRSWRKGAAMFLFNRYVAFLTIPVTIYTEFPMVTTPTHLTLYRQIAIGIMQLIVGANQLLRVYALYGLDRRIAAFIALTAAAVVAISVWAVTMQKDSDAGMGCHLMISSDTADRLSIVWASLFVYNLLIFALMLIKAPKNRAQLAQAKRGSLVTIVYRDGVMYFAVVVCVQCADFISFYVFPPALKGALSTLASSISLTMMSRCILNLHEYDAQVRGVTGVSEMYSLGCPAPIAGASDCFGEQSV